MSLPWVKTRRPWTMKRTVSVVFSVLSTLLLAGFCLLAWPTSLGGKAAWVTVSGTSMLPNYRTGDMVLAWNDGNWHVGDVVLYSVDGTSTNLIVHRLVSGDATSGWIAQGDNKPAPDPWTIPQSSVRGRELVHIPFVGVVLTAARTPQVLAIAAGALVFGAVLMVPKRKRKLERIKVDEPCIVGGVPGKVKDLHIAGARVEVADTAEISQSVDISVWLNAPDGTRQIVSGVLSVRYNNLVEGSRLIGGPITWSDPGDPEIVAHHCAAYVLVDSA